MTTQTSLRTPRFGEIEFTELDVVTFTDGLIGFPDLRRFVVINHREGSDFRWLQSVDQPDFALLVIDPDIVFADYRPVVDPTNAPELELSEESPRLVYTIVTIPKGKPENMSVNLAGPIVINPVSRLARQFVLADETYGTKHPILATQHPTGEPAAA